MQRFAPIAVMLGLALAGCARNAPPAPPAAPSAAPTAAATPAGAGTKAPPITGTTRAGKPFRLSDYRGKTVLVNFFSPG